MKNKINKGKCRLCGLEKNLCESHIFPQFISDWLKETSATGRMRSFLKPNLRVQDTKTFKLLCKECEQIFGNAEKYFAETVFKPVMNADNPILDYKSQLKKFAVSMAWRILVHTQDTSQSKLRHPQDIAKAEAIWRRFLQLEPEMNTFDHHMLMLRYVEGAPKFEGTDIDINWYFFRTVDGTIIQNADESFVFTKLPGFAFFSAVRSGGFNYSENTLISEFGNFDLRSQTLHKPIFKYLVDRSEVALSPLRTLSQQQKDKIEHDCSKDIDRVENSFGFKLFLKK